MGVLAGLGKAAGFGGRAAVLPAISLPSFPLAREGQLQRRKFLSAHPELVEG